MNSPNHQKNSARPRMVAVIDIGASSLKMQIAEIFENTGEIRRVESFSQAVSIGVDSFSERRISKITQEGCVGVLQAYRNKLNEYGIVSPNQIRVVATSGVREANNRIAFIDRVYVATGFEVEPFDEAELHRVTYLGILPFIEKQPKYFADESLVLEVGGGTSEFLVLRQSDVEFSRSYRLGALRLRHGLEGFEGPAAKTWSLMESQIAKTINEIRVEAKFPKPKNMIAMGGEVRFAANQITQKPFNQKLTELKLSQLQKFTDDVLSQTPNQLVNRYHMSLTDAKSLGPGLLTHLIFAKEFNIKKFLVAQVNLRDGLIQEMSLEEGWDSSIQKQIVRSAIQLGRKYKFDENHAVHVSLLACSLFDDLSAMHRLSPRYRGILELSSLLHDVGNFVSAKARHKHTMYLIQHSDIFGVSAKMQKNISMVARYHRGATPSVRHELYALLPRAQRVAVAKLASLLRIAKALDVSRKQRLQKVTARVSDQSVQLSTNDVVDLALERLELQQVGTMFEDIFGTEVVLSTDDGKQ